MCCEFSGGLHLWPNTASCLQLCVPHSCHDCCSTHSFHNHGQVLRIDSAIEPSTFFTPPTTVVSSAPTSLPAAALQKESSHGWLHTELPSITSEARLCSDSLGLEKKQEGEKWRHAGHGPACCVIFIRI